MIDDRAESSYRVRTEAATKARHRVHPTHKSNGDETRYATAQYAMSFTKGLDHNPLTGLVNDRQHFEAFRHAIDVGEIEAFTTRVPVPQVEARRQWDAPTAGTAYELIGPDPQAVTMPPAPELCSDELAYEMAEVYELALLRDINLTSFDQNGGPGSATLNDSLARLNALPYAVQGYQGRPRKTDTAGSVTRQTAFRGSSPGVEDGPYLSQFLMLGTVNPSGANSELDGLISYGGQCIDQRVLVAEDGVDFMQTWNDWLSVQQGYDVNGIMGNAGQPLDGSKRFICTPRDLATYVHYDALYQAYLNAALMLLGMRAPYDPAFANLSGQRPIFDMHQGFPGLHLNAGGFALYGGPHILTLVTEVATRALKAVRFQKFNNHLRLRPEALAARIERADEIDENHPGTCGAFRKLEQQISCTVGEIRDFNATAPNGGDATALLPMAFAEGSPMHPAYGAGHATVAGACVTVLKAFFDTSALLGRKDGRLGFFGEIDNAAYVEVVEKGASLAERERGCPLTLEGELNKLAANISIGRNMAGVHYFTDYYDSLRMGEEIAIGMLEEQSICYPTNEVVFSLQTFDGDCVRIGRR